MFRSVFFALTLSVCWCEYLWQQEIVDSLLDIDIKSEFESWKSYFGKEYSTRIEEELRLAIFGKNWYNINNHNKNGDSGYTLRLNQFGDLTEVEFNRYVQQGARSPMQTSSKFPKLSTQRTPQDLEELPQLNAADSIDWTNISGVSYVTPVKDQGNCGSCWAFSAVGSLESFYAISENVTGSDIVELSEQQLVDCTYAVPDGCQGGLQEDAFTYISKFGGLCTEEEYPYTARDGSCYDKTCGTLYNSIDGYKTVTKNSETALVDAINIGPIAVSVDAAGFGWQFYSGGVYSGDCGILLDHGVVGVGYGTDPSEGDYWKIKNSWGTSWGMEGYILICRNCNKNGNSGECGILRDNTYPVLPN